MKKYLQSKKYCFYFVIVLTMLGLNNVFGQTSSHQTVKGFFTKDSCLVGELVHFVVYSEHSPEQEIFFPDSTYDFTPFEWVSKSFFPTHTEKNRSKDSVVYTLRSFDLSPKLLFSLPVFERIHQDTLRHYSAEDSLFVKKTAAFSDEKTALKTNTDWLESEIKVDYVWWAVWISALMLASILGFWLFGAPVKKMYRKWLLDRAHESFLAQFEKYRVQISVNKEVDVLEKLISHWKTYLQKTLQKPIRSYTSREIALTLKDEQIKDVLQKLDRAIYGGVYPMDIDVDLDYLLKTAIQSYEKTK